MNTITTTEILNLYSNYPECPLLIFDSIHPVPDKLEGIDYYSQKIFSERLTWEVNKVKLILKPLKNISNKDASTIAYLVNKELITKSYYDPITLGKTYVQYILDGNCKNFDFSLQDFIKIINYLKEQFYDLPFYFDKRDNKTKTLIELNLAVDKTKLHSKKNLDYPVNIDFSKQESLISFFINQYPEIEFEYSKIKQFKKDIKFLSKYYNLKQDIIDKWTGQYINGPNDTEYSGFVYLFDTTNTYLTTVRVN